MYTVTFKQLGGNVICINVFDLQNRMIFIDMLQKNIQGEYKFTIDVFNYDYKANIKHKQIKSENEIIIEYLIQNKYLILLDVKEHKYLKTYTMKLTTMSLLLTL